MVMMLNRDTWKADLAKFFASPAFFLVLWITGGLLSVFVPLRQWNKENARYYTYYGQYQEQEEDNEDENNGYNGYNGYGTNCKWYQWQCKANVYNYNNGDNNGDSVPLPNWWIGTFGGLSEEERREQEENVETSGALKFVYVWSLLIFIAIIAYGAYVVIKRRKASGLLATLFVFTNYAVLSAILLGQGVIQDEGRELEYVGFYGQFSVLMFMTFFWYALFGAISGLLFGIRHLLLARLLGGGEKEQEEDATAYKNYDAPEVSYGQNA